LSALETVVEPPLPEKDKRLIVDDGALVIVDLEEQLNSLADKVRGLTDTVEGAIGRWEFIYPGAIQYWRLLMGPRDRQLAEIYFDGGAQARWDV
jgi:hypothetical protein